MLLVFHCRSQSFKLPSSTYFNIKNNVFLRKKKRSISPYANITLVFSVEFFKFSLVTKVSTCKHSALLFLQATRNIASIYGQCSINEWRIPSFTKQRKLTRFFPCHCLDARGHSAPSVTRSPHGQPKPPLCHRSPLKAVRLWIFRLFLMAAFIRSLKNF